jgi:hypothetical protein
MKKIFAIFISMLFVASLSLAVVGCKKAEEKHQQRLLKLKHPLLSLHPVGTAVPAPAPAPGAPGAPGAPQHLHPAPAK